MPYYMTGDYYRGDYYRRSRGDFFGTLGGILGGIGTVAGGFLTGGPIGALKAAGGLVTNKGSSTGSTLQPEKPPLQLPPGPTPGGLQRFKNVEAAVLTGAVPKGYHLNKHREYPSAGAEKGTKIVRNRRMNAGNAHALRRAIHREKAFINLAKQALRGTGITVSRRSVASRHHRGSHR